MVKKLSPEERLIVAADFSDEPDRSLNALCEDLVDTGVYIKVNSVLRLFGYPCMSQIRDYGLKVFADLKLNDIGNTLATDGKLLKMFQPELLTVMCSTGRDAIRKLKDELPDTELLGVTVLTTFDDVECLEVYGRMVDVKVVQLASLGLQSGLDGIICSPAEAALLRQEIGDGFTINCPGVRPLVSLVEGDDQNPDRIMTPAKAIGAGVDRCVIGRPILQAKDRYNTTQAIIEEIASAL